MTKRVAEYIIDLLDNDQSDLKEYFKRCRRDWRWLVREDIKEEMRGALYQARLDITKYYKCDCDTKWRVRNCYSYDVPKIKYSDDDSDDDRRAMREEIENIRGDPSVIWNCGPIARITCDKLQQLIDYCKLLGFKISGIFGDREGIQVFVHWAHWVDKKGEII